MNIDNFYVYYYIIIGYLRYINKNMNTAVTIIHHRHSIGLMIFSIYIRAPFVCYYIDNIFA